ncbi:hypothetical protein HD806DRAFT_524048 [Xylariaceae sp. AK1471]|nr:hypothetical protein HD806DRAFT_524048 [Xylariaceae sp. AK1471]
MFHTTSQADKAAESSPRPTDNNGHGGGSSASLSEAEKRATVSSVLSTAAASITTTTAPPPKLRSCVVCRSRKVRCDKESPCSNCRRANIACVFPSTDRPPRWARRLERVAQNAAAGERSAQAADPVANQMMERLRNLESLVKDLSGQLEQAHAAANSSTGNSPGSSPNDRDTDHQKAASSTMSTGNIQSQFGRLVLNDASRSRYVSSGFWSRVNDEIDEIKVEAQSLAEVGPDSSEDEGLSGTSPSTRELERTPAERHAFLFRHNLNSSGPDLRELHPLPSQIPFLLDVFSENVNYIVQIVHMPTIKKMVRRPRGNDIIQLTPANEALMFSIYYAAITSMDEDDVVSNFGSTKTELNLKYRLGLEHALARADFLNVPDVVLVQAFAIFLFLVRRHDSPRFVWMMTGLVIRMGQALGLQRDGTYFEHLTPFEIEIRRRVWYSLCALDVRASEDQGTDFTIQYGSFDTKLPLNINDDEIDVHTKQTPMEREGLTDITVPLTFMDISNISRQMMSPGVGLEEQNRLLDTTYAILEKRYLRFLTESGDITYWVPVVVTRLMGGKLTLFTHLPVLFSSPGEHFSDEVRNKLLVAAIEVAEFNHALNAEKACRQWRWAFQTYTHWHAVVYLLIDICRRPWSSIVERAWIALHDPWLIPARSNLDKGLRTWVPLRKLMLKARKHRDTELERLRGDALAARQLDEEDMKLPVPSTVGSVSASGAADLFREGWRRLVGNSEKSEDHAQILARPAIEKRTSPASSQPMTSAQTLPDSTYFGPKNTRGTSSGSQPFYPAVTDRMIADPVTSHTSSVPLTAYDTMSLDQSFSNGLHYNAFSQPAVDWSDGHPENGGLLSWFWADADPAVDVFANMDDEMDINFDLDGEINWLDWVESAKGMEVDAHASASRPNR